MLSIDAASRTSLELVKSASGEKASTRCSPRSIRTVTAAGARELQGARGLAARRSRPDRSPARCRAVPVRAPAAGRRAEGSTLRGAPDIARALSRLAFNRGGPRDLGAVRDGLEAAAACADELQRAGCEPRPARGACGTIADVLIAARDSKLAQSLRAALTQELPHLKRDGGFIEAGYSADLDAARPSATTAAS